MRSEKYIRWILAPLLFAAMPAWAANHTVMVGQNTQGQDAFAFNPPTLTIAAGDTVTFTNNSGGLHNVHSTSGLTSFHCSVDCVSNNAPDTSAWSDTVTFPSADTINYQCDQHGQAFGMVGTITVQGSTPVKLQSFDVN
jgi:plastocyanin